MKGDPFSILPNAVGVVPERIDLPIRSQVEPKVDAMEPVSLDLVPDDKTAVVDEEEAACVSNGRAAGNGVIQHRPKEIEVIVRTKVLHARVSTSPPFKGTIGGNGERNLIDHDGVVSPG